MNRLPVALITACTLLSSPYFVHAATQPQLSTSTAGESVADRTKALNGVFDDIWQDKLKHSPEYASILGDKRYNDQLSDYSPKAVNDALQRGIQFIQRLSAIDTTGMAPQDKLSAELMLRSLIDDQEGAKFKEWEMPADQFNGFQVSLVQIISDLPFDTVKDYDDYIARMKKVPTAFSQLQQDMELGMDDGRMPPQYILEKVLAQTQAIADKTPETSPFAEPLKKFPKTITAAEQKRISADLLDAIKTSTLPAYQHMAKFFSAQYIPKGRKDPGAWALPDGDAYYAWRIRQSTTLTKSASEIHQIGLDEVKRDEADMLAIAKKLGYPDLKSFGAALKANPKMHPASKEQLLDTYRGYIGQMNAKLPQIFGTLPKAKLEVIAMPDAIAKDQAAAFYDQGSADGKRPGHVDINTYNFADRLLPDAEAVAYHEGIPGHHLQISIAQELTGIPEFRKQSYYTAYTEGWALYSERLGKEVGFYQDPYSDYGRLEADIWRAIRLVVDTGVHSQHWNRQQMVDFFHDHSTIDDTNVNAEVDRYIAWPGQALGYKMGQLKILELRARAQKELGPKFDIRAFHDVVIDSGALPMDVLEQQVETWIKTRQTQ
jgi:uncharacterized protein (DUF885 family)